ncbi:hypothetical protein DPEC_G00118600 [Dallia pectoralis]|uniref:Uncharacterized protein n=1 Tax=Dallia pectoralis TaxID=75939 RepID=A0ACC2GPX0_DALPE|nr:hypothetical protein DPEC_G00118600 [Dallia pectoralis]
MLDNMQPVVIDTLSIRLNMDFTEEEKQWLFSLSSEIPNCSELTSLEEHLRQLAEPVSLLEALWFQMSASIQFGLSCPHRVSQGPEPATKHADKLYLINNT